MTISFIRTGVVVNSISPELGLVLDCPHLKISAFSRLSGINKSLRAPSQDGAQYSVDVCKGADTEGRLDFYHLGCDWGIANESTDPFT